MLESVIEIKEYKSVNPYCVLGVMNNEKGLEIAERMRNWLIPNYNLIEVYHDGMLFEYPALKYMQDLCKKTGEPCLYLHTRGAVNEYWTTPVTHKVWEDEFGYGKSFYFAMANVDKATPMVICPFTSPKKHTFYNGFVANAAAMSAIPEIVRNFDRYYYEDLFKDSDVLVIGTKTCSDIKAAREYLIKVRG